MWSMDECKYTCVIKTPRSIIWEVFEQDPVACILTLFYEYKDGRAENKQLVTFTDEKAPQGPEKVRQTEGNGNQSVRPRSILFIWVSTIVKFSSK